MWYVIFYSIHDSINQEMEKHYKTIDMKLNKLIQTQTKSFNYQGQFYLRVINKTDITFINPLTPNGLYSGRAVSPFK